MVMLQAKFSRAAVLLMVGLGIGSACVASRVGSSAAPAASAVQGAVQQPAGQQLDESASLRTGTVTALDDRGSRVQVQGIWLEVLDGKTQLSRQGQAARADTLKVGEKIRFTVAPGTGEALVLRVVYVP